MHKALDFYIEISGKCNAKCPYCARQRFEQRYSGRSMSPGLFEQILNRLTGLGLLDRDHVSAIKLYNWGEPFLNPEINKILGILKKNKLFADVSSNFIVKPEIDKGLLTVISSVTFSLSGFSQESYGKIHGAALDMVLDNFEDFYKKINVSAPDAKIIISWHRYKFNENELWEAYKYFDRPGIRFLPTVAYFNDLPEMLSFARGKLPEIRQTRAQGELFLDHISRGLAYHKQRSKNYRCFMRDQLVIDESGQLLLCCGMNAFDQEHVLGNILEMSVDDIFKEKMRDPICPTCISSGFPRAINAIGHKPLPPGGKSRFIKLWLQFNLSDPCLSYLHSKVGGIVKGLPGGGNIFRKLKKMF
jgi:organic radical activating enzyme